MWEPQKRWRMKNRKRANFVANLRRKQRRTEEPWYKTWENIWKRCVKNKDKKKMQVYYEKGIRCKITCRDLKKIWFRDKAYLMLRPSIDRLDSAKNYSLENCRYIEYLENCRMGGINRASKMLEEKLCNK